MARRAKRGAAKPKEAKQPKAEQSIFDWIREHEGKLKDGDMDFLLDFTDKKSAIPEPPPDVEDLGPDAAWVRGSGVTPLEFLVHLYRHPMQKPSDRIAAARGVLDYAHKKAVALRLEGSIDVNKRMDPGAMAKLSPKELDVLVKLLEKMESA